MRGKDEGRMRGRLRLSIKKRKGGPSSRSLMMKERMMRPVTAPLAVNLNLERNRWQISLRKRANR